MFMSFPNDRPLHHHVATCHGVFSQSASGHVYEYECGSRKSAISESVRDSVRFNVIQCGTMVLNFVTDNPGPHANN